MQGVQYDLEAVHSSVHPAVVRASIVLPEVHINTTMAAGNISTAGVNSSGSSTTGAITNDDHTGSGMPQGSQGRAPGMARQHRRSDGWDSTRYRHYHPDDDQDIGVRGSSGCTDDDAELAGSNSAVVVEDPEIMGAAARQELVGLAARWVR